MAGETMGPDGPGFKVCKACLVEKPLEKFALEPRVKSGTTARCAECLNATNRRYREQHPERVVASRKKYADKFPERIQESKNFTSRREKLERLERRLKRGLPPIADRTTEDGRRCSKCRRRKTLAEFGPTPNSGDGFHSWCRECLAKDGRKRLTLLSPEKREHRRRWSRRYDAEKKYGVPFEELERRLEAQGSVCKICSDAIDLWALRSGCVDHDHVTLQIRGILCVKCNAGLGQFRDRPELLASAITYLAEQLKSSDTS